MISAGTDPMEVQRSHASIAKHLPTIVRLYMSREAGRLTRENWIVDAIRPLARKIELLNPAVKDGGRSPQNFGDRNTCRPIATFEGVLSIQAPWS